MFADLQVVGARLDELGVVEPEYVHLAEDRLEASRCVNSDLMYNDLCASGTDAVSWSSRTLTLRSANAAYVRSSIASTAGVVSAASVPCSQLSKPVLYAMLV